MTHLKKSDDSNTDRVCTLLVYFMHVVYFNVQLRIVFDVMETGLELQFDMFSRKHERHKFEKNVFGGNA